MSSKLKLTGTGGGDTIIQGNDSITTDQTFTFPDNGGELVIASTNSGGQPVPGYQQGVWTPTVAEGTVNAIRPYWSRIGNTIFVTVLINTFSDRSAGSTVRVESLPYPAISGYNNAAGPLMAQYINSGADGGWTTYLNSDSQFQFYRTTASGWVSMKHSDLNNSASSLHICATYLTDNTDWDPKNGATVS